MTDSAQSDLPNTMTSSSSSQSSASPPGCERWAWSLQHLFEDDEGRTLFEKYVESEGPLHKTRFKFYFLCEGLRVKKDDNKTPLKTLVRLIFYRYVMKLKLPVPQDLEDYVERVLEGTELRLQPERFDQLKFQVMRAISESTYPSFLQSDMYLQRLQYHRSAMGNTPDPLIATTNITTSTSPSLSETSSFLVSRSSTLPTLLEEGEGPQNEGSEPAGASGFSDTMRRAPTLISSASRSRVPMSLTKDALMATQSRRLEMRPPGYVLKANPSFYWWRWWEAFKDDRIDEWSVLPNRH